MNNNNKNSRFTAHFGANKSSIAAESSTTNRNSFVKYFKKYSDVKAEEQNDNVS